MQNTHLFVAAVGCAWGVGRCAILVVAVRV
jgi:hypothetical protein